MLNFLKENKYKITTWIVRIITIIMIVYCIMQKEYMNLVYLTVTFLLTFYDTLVEKVTKVKLNEILKFSVLFIIVGAQLLGTILDWYGKYDWWDTLLHACSGIVFYYIGKLWIGKIYEHVGKNKENQIPKKVEIAFAFFFSLAVCVIWEIFEFIMDKYFGFNMQCAKNEIGQNAIMDTMVDMIAETIGAFIMMIIDLIKVKKENK